MNQEEEKQKSLPEDDVEAYFAQLTQGQAKEKVAQINKLASGPAKDTVKAILFGAANKGILPKHALRLGDDTMEAVYSQAYTLYNQGKYKEASYIFRLLMLLDYLTPKYVLGLAACLHRMKEYKNAANIYLLCGTLDASNPLPHYHAADCYLQMQCPEMASFSLGLAIDTAKDQAQYSVIKERAILMKEALDKELNEKSKKIKSEENIQAQPKQEAKK